MDQVKIGKFIAERRKTLGLTQKQLANALYITDRAVSKWENGRAMPDSSIMLQLCELLQITVNDLLNGEVIIMENYKEKNEELLLEMIKQKEEYDKMLLTLETIIGLLAVIVLIGFTFVAAYFEISAACSAGLIVFAFITSLTALFYALKLEQIAGYYECQHCHHKYVPEYWSVFWAAHFGRTRYMKCPECGKRSWQKKVISK